MSPKIFVFYPLSRAVEIELPSFECAYTFSSLHNHTL